MKKQEQNLNPKDKSSRGNASQFYVAGELCRRGYSAVVTLGNTPNTDILCSNIEGTKFVHIQVKTFVPGKHSCTVGPKVEKAFGENFFWVLAGIPHPDSKNQFEFFIIPSSVMAKNMIEVYKQWLETPGAKGRAHKPNKFRSVMLPPKNNFNGWNINEYFGRWDLIETKLK